MKRIATLFIIALIVLGVQAGWAADQKPAGAQPALKGLDPIEFIAGRTVQGDPKISADYNNFRYVFSSEKNRAQFKKNPAQYSIQGDGTCIVAPDYKVDPNIAVVYKERIYAFATVGCVGLFQENPEKYVARIPLLNKKKGAKG